MILELARRFMVWFQGRGLYWLSLFLGGPLYQYTLHAGYMHLPNSRSVPGSDGNHELLCYLPESTAAAGAVLNETRLTATRRIVSMSLRSIISLEHTRIFSVCSRLYDRWSLNIPGRSPLFSCAYSFRERARPARLSLMHVYSLRQLHPSSLF
jgi:hypothetical protein